MRLLTPSDKRAAVAHAGKVRGSVPPLVAPSLLPSALWCKSKRVCSLSSSCASCETIKSCQAAGCASDGLALEASLAFPTVGSVGEGIGPDVGSLLRAPDTGDTGTGDKFEGSKAALLKCIDPERGSVFSDVPHSKASQNGIKFYRHALPVDRLGEPSPLFTFTEHVQICMCLKLKRLGHASHGFLLESYFSSVSFSNARRGPGSKGLKRARCSRQCQCPTTLLLLLIVCIPTQLRGAVRAQLFAACAPQKGGDSRHRGLRC